MRVRRLMVLGLVVFGLCPALAGAQGREPLAVTSVGLRVGWVFGHGLVAGVEASRLKAADPLGIGYPSAFTGGVFGADLVLAADGLRARITLEAEGAYTFAGLSAGAGVEIGQRVTPLLVATPFAGVTTGFDGPFVAGREAYPLLIPYYRLAWAIGDGLRHEAGGLFKLAVYRAP